MPHLISESMAEISFEETTNSSKIYLYTQTYGSGWGDFNGDGWQDLWSGNHFKYPQLNLNNKNGTFTNVINQTGLGFFYDYDLHGSSWIDFDNDGDQDLLVLTGAEGGVGFGPNLLLENKNGTFQDFAEDYGLDFPLGRARAPMWFDWDNDGLLDLIISNLPRLDGLAPTSFFHQTPKGFENLTPIDGFDLIKPYGAIQLFSPKNIMHIFYLTPYEEGIYNLSNFPDNILEEPLMKIKFKNLHTPNLPSLRNPQSVDLAIEDFNGDLLLDIFQTKSELNSYAFVEDSKNVFVHLILKDAGEQNLKIFTNGTLNFHFITLTRHYNITDIYIGSDGFQQELSDVNGTDNLFNLRLNEEGGFSFSLSPNDKKVWGIFDHNTGIDRGLYIGYDSNRKLWEIQHSSPNPSTPQFEISSTNPILDMIHDETKLNPVFLGETKFNEAFLKDQLLIQTQSGLEDSTISKGFETPTSCGSLGTGDFDNDMDIDIYLVCSVSTKNLPNILYENIENREFVAVDNAGGAIGSDLGIGDTVSIADYDRDGFLDLFVTNGEHSRGFKKIAPSQLFKNMGNENHWIEIDLEGTTSNRDGIGARVYITANDTSQVQKQSGGIHYRSQDSKTIHFGLGQNELVDSITILWPSGIIQEKKNIPADQIIKIMEESSNVSPKHQKSLRIEPEDIKCSNDLVLILKASTNEPACVKQNSVNKLIDRNWGITIE